MITRELNHRRQSFSDTFKILLKHTADALPLIDYQLSPFKDYHCNAAPWIEGQTSGKRLTINTRPIHDPLDSRKFEASASVFIVNEHAYIKVPYDPRSTLLCRIDKLSGSVIGEAFCEMHRTEFRRIFHALCDYYEGAEAIEKPF